jgi:tRNA threonylcarbamoyladenosine biosynthesis protein TsaE
MATHISRSPEDTAALGAAWGAAADAGLVIGLAGDLGAGKTQLVRGIARGLGVSCLVHSPTFNLINIYPGGRLCLLHLDLFRLETDAAIMGAGLTEYFNPPGVAVVEWIDRWQGPRPPRYRHVMIEILSEQERQITDEDFGA